MTTQTELLQEVREALSHLYDYPHLENLSLALRFWPEPGPQGPGRGYRLSRLLLETIEALHPPNPLAGPTPSHARAYTLLVRRYVDERPLDELLREFGYSRRQFFREISKALAILVTQLWEKLAQQIPVVPEDQLAAQARRMLEQSDTIDLYQLVSGVQELAEHLAAQRGVGFALDLGRWLPAVRGNRTLLRQVFLDITSRLLALPGAHQVRLGAHWVHQRVLVEWRVQYSEPGHPPQSSLDDLGEALTEAEHLVNLMGGSWLGVQAISEGWTCRFDLSAIGQRVLLVIEDNEGVIQAFRRQLAAYDYTVVGAMTSAEALRLARELRPVAITLDVMMPAEDGWEMLQKIKGEPDIRSIPVIVCSVLESPDLAISLGADAYLRKPISQASLLAMLDRVVSGR